MLDLWERGDAYGDSTTPAVADPEYRRFIVDSLVRELGSVTNRSIVSIGCGNAFVEALLVSAGARVLAVEPSAHAVRLARSKGVNVEEAAFETWQVGGRRFDAVYCDGTLGHLAADVRGLRAAIARLATLPTPGGTVLLSTDVAGSESPVPHPMVQGFTLFPSPSIRTAIEEAGLAITRETDYIYRRPVSGPRRRSLWLARRSGAEQ